MKILKKPLLLARELIRLSVTPGDAVVDATAGNGHDTLFLAELVGDRGAVYAFDIQQDAISRTTERLLQAQMLSRVQLICSGHENIAYYVKENVSAVMFNLGYLPGRDHRFVTKPETTLTALQASLNIIKPGGIITLVLYSGHPGGEEEKVAVINYSRHLPQEDFAVSLFEMINWSNHPPALLAIEKKRSLVE